MSGKPVLTVLGIALAAVASAAGPTRTISIAGEWRVRLDPEDAGIAQEWFKTNFPDSIPLPGSTDEHRLGRQNERRELGHLTRAYEYVGPVWYEREVAIPESWARKRIDLFLERCHWETQAWLDDRHLGLQNSLTTPHVYDLGQVVKPGTHRLTIRVDNRVKIDVGRWASAVTEEGPSNWNGIVGRLELRATDVVWIDSLSVYPDPPNRLVHVKVKIRNLTGEPLAAELSLSVSLRGAPGERHESSSRIAILRTPMAAIEIDLPLGPQVRLWSEFSPALYDLSASLCSARPADEFSDAASTTFGLRQFGTAGKRFTWNGRTIVLRGTVDNGAFPQMGHPPMEFETWRKRIAAYRSFGMNHVRFHSWCPPEAAFAAADELGMTFQVENPMWIGDGRISADSMRTAFIRQEAMRIVETYGNHPSFAMMTMGNELGNGQDVFLGELVSALRQHDPRHLYSSTTAPDNVRRPDDYFVSAGPQWQNLRGDPRLEQNPPNTDFDYHEYLASIDRPVVAHELGQWTVYPDFREAVKYDGALQPRYLGVYRESLARHHLFEQGEDFRKASGALMVALYKEEIESILRTPGLAGFQLLGLTDWPGFGPAFIGVLDTFTHSKGLIAPEAFRRFCDSTVPLLRIRKRLWSTNENLSALAMIAHFGPEDLPGAKPTWRMCDERSAIVASGSLPERTISTGGLTDLGEMQLSLAKLAAPGRYNIELSVGVFRNDWNIWVYPEKLGPVGQGVLVTKDWPEARRALENGGRVLFLPDAKKLAGIVPTSFTTAFWSLRWFPGRPETMGILCDPRHAALRSFPTESHADWQWWELMSRSRAFILDGAPPDYRPIVQVIDDINRNHRLGAVLEARVGRGKLLVSSFDLDSDLGMRLAARQLRQSLMVYAASEQFQPASELDMAFLGALFTQGADR